MLRKSITTIQREERAPPLRKARVIVRKISLMVRTRNNPQHSWLGLTEQQNLTLFRGEARVMVLGKGTAKQAKRSFKGKGVGGFRGIVRFWEEWCGNPSGSRPNFFGRQHLTFDKGGKDIVLFEV